MLASDRRSFGNVLNLCESVEFIYNVLKIKTVIFYTKKICVFIIIRQRILLHFMSKKKNKNRVSGFWGFGTWSVFDLLYMYN